MILKQKRHDDLTLSGNIKWLKNTVISSDAARNFLKKLANELTFCFFHTSNVIYLFLVCENLFKGRHILQSRNNALKGEQFIHPRFFNLIAIRFMTQFRIPIGIPMSFRLNGYPDGRNSKLALRKSYI